MIRVFIVYPAALAFMLTGCVPRIELAMPKQPVTINMNVKIEHEITIKADKQSAALLQPTLCQAGAQACRESK